MLRWKVDVEGLPPFYMEGKSAGIIRLELKKRIKNPKLIQSIKRTPETVYKKALREIIKNIGK